MTTQLLPDLNIVNPEYGAKYSRALTLLNIWDYNPYINAFARAHATMPISLRTEVGSTSNTLFFIPYLEQNDPGRKLLAQEHLKRTVRDLIGIIEAKNGCLVDTDIKQMNHFYPPITVGINFGWQEVNKERIEGTSICAIYRPNRFLGNKYGILKIHPDDWHEQRRSSHLTDLTFMGDFKVLQAGIAYPLETDECMQYITGV